MNKFKLLFGINKDETKKTCILTPILTREIRQVFNLPILKKGKLYKCADTDNFTLIRTGIGAPFVGDAVLYLADTPCENLILFGSCGLTAKSGQLDIGQLLLPKESLQLESFSACLTVSDPEIKNYSFDQYLLNKMLDYFPGHGLQTVRSATIGSLAMEEKLLERLLKKQVKTIDMEASAFFSAAELLKKKALALFYSTDIIQDRPLYQDLTPAEKERVRKAESKGAELLLTFTKLLSTS